MVTLRPPMTNLFSSMKVQVGPVSNPTGVILIRCFLVFQFAIPSSSVVVGSAIATSNAPWPSSVWTNANCFALARRLLIADPLITGTSPEMRKLILFNFYSRVHFLFYFCKLKKKRRRLSSTNCDLSREDSASLDVTSSRVFYSDPDVDYYQRVGKGQGCYRPYVRPPVSPTSNNEYYYGSNSGGSLIQRPSSSVQPVAIGAASINGN